MVSMDRNEPMESFMNSIQVVKDAFLPLELGFRKAAKDLETCWGVSKNRVHTHSIGKGDDSSVATRVELVSENGKVQICGVKKKRGDGQSLVGGGEEERKKSIKVPIKTFLGMFSLNLENGRRSNRRGGASCGARKAGESKKEEGMESEDGSSCTNCLRFAVTWSLLVNGFVQAFPSPFKMSKKRLQKLGSGSECEGYVHLCKHGLRANGFTQIKQREIMEQGGKEFQDVVVGYNEGKHVSLECCVGFVFDQLVHNLLKLEQSLKESDRSSCISDCSTPPDMGSLKSITNFWEGQKLYVDGFLGNLSFARVGGVPASVVGVSSTVNEDGDDGASAGGSEETRGSSPQKIASGILSIPLSNVERLRSTLSTVSLTELIELVPHLGRPSKDYPDKKKLISVQDFFRYTESEGRRFFEDLDRDADGEVTLEDLEVEMRRRKLPRRYARDFMRRAKRHLFSKSFGWKQFLSLMEQKEPTILRAYTSLCLSKSGTLKKSEVLSSLQNAGLPANEDNAVAMMRFLNADTEESISYGHFRNFMLLLPSDRLQDDPRNIWFEAATVVPVAPPVEIPTGSVLRSALAGGLSCALSCALMHPVDTIKTRVQASTLSFPEIISKLPKIGVQGLYRGSIPAIWGQFSSSNCSHGLRTGIFEASKLVMINFAPTMPGVQVQTIASFCSTFLGTAVRIPCEVLKQRLQAGLFDNAGQALVGTWQHDGLRGFFRGTGATLCREVPFYVAGTCLYGESKKVVQNLLRRELEPWETIMVGAVSGGFAAVLTTPFDVMKTRMMTAQGRAVPMSIVALSIVRHEGPLGLFKGALPRFFWIAPLGAMNFAGYELLSKSMEKNEESPNDLPSQKKLTSPG